jgi:hypothetical protein
LAPGLAAREFGWRAVTRITGRRGEGTWPILGAHRKAAESAAD